MSGLSLLSVELTVGAWILFMLGLDMLLGRTSRPAVLWSAALAGVLIASGVLLVSAPGWTGQTFQGMYLADGFAAYFKGLFLLTVAIVLVMARRFHDQFGGNAGVFYLLMYTALLGMLVLASAHDLLLLFIGLELLTFSLYIMAAYLKTDPRAVEAGMKYLILGSVSSGIFVYGMALLYGAAGSTAFSAIRFMLSEPGAPATASIGMLFVLAGLGFKVGAVPFHLWVPDVYEGAPTPVVALLSAGSKMAGFVAMMRVLFGAFEPAAALWAPVLAALAAATMLYGNLGALPQTNIKRLLGYSSIGHAGYLLMGVAVGGAAGMHAVGFYLLAYLFSNLAVFLAVVETSRAVGGDALERYDGLARRAPFLAAAMFVGLLSLAGVPPLAGFAGKLFVFLAAVEGGLLWLVAVGAVNVAVSLYYYLLVVKRMYLGDPGLGAPIPLGPLSRMTLAFLFLGILAIGVFQEPFLRHIALSFSR
ncbi:MAG TPA: NADH-quinone oxidoreductase subunit N [bacterium]